MSETAYLYIQVLCPICRDYTLRQVDDSLKCDYCKVAWKQPTIELERLNSESSEK